MKQIIIPFTENADIPESHLYAFRACNSGGAWAYKYSFYKLKNELLLKYGHEADYDLQHVVKKCYTCGGSGWYNEVNRCHNCDNGVYSRKDVILKRWILNGAIFHQPIGELTGGNRIKIFDGYEEEEDGWHEYPKFRYETFNGKIISTITGLIKHKPIGLNPMWAYYYLLWNYDRDRFYKIMQSDLNTMQTNTKYKLKRLLRKLNPIIAYAEFFEVKNEHLADIDDLPF